MVRTCCPSRQLKQHKEKNALTLDEDPDARKEDRTETEAE